jgi:hypothetical protein
MDGFLLMKHFTLKILYFLENVLRVSEPYQDKLYYYSEIHPPQVSHSQEYIALCNGFMVDTKKQKLQKHF